ncbi:MAG: efflux RND transporter permease subunit [Candidatus Melainabacteria bacterium]|nr:efflux RND transporter permease subunit [Candidatus Melainabacteria bacterium]
MFVNFFISRPIFASVCSLFIVIAGLVSIPNLPISQYPAIVPPQVKVTSVYTGASAAAVEASVTNVLEQQINGVKGMKYITSTSGNDGTSTINVTFDLDRDVDAAAVDVQNRVGSVQGRLPEEVKKTGVTVDKVSTTIIFAAALASKTHDALYLSNYADLYIKDNLKRVKGVGDVTIFGERKYSMRIWLDPSKLNNRQITTSDVTKALADQSVQVASGSIGKAPYPEGQAFEISTRVSGRLKTPEEFSNIVIKRGPNGSVVKLKDVGRVELGAENYGTFLRYKGANAVGIAIYQFPGANALDVARECKAELAKLTANLPPDITCQIAFDTTRAVEESIQEVIKTLAEAIFLVILVIFLFLQSWRTTIIPAITIPVSLIGTFAAMKALDFSINTLTLFGITLATGLVVDDAIVVIENIVRLMEEPNPFFAGINWCIDMVRKFFEQALGIVLKFKMIVVPAFIASLALTGYLYTKMPTGFLPDEDVGYFMIIVQGPDGVSLDYTSKVVAKVEKVVSNIPELLGVFAVGGFSFSGNNSSNAIVFCTLKPWSERTRPDQSAAAIINKLRGPLFGIDDAFCIPFNPPPILGLVNVGGFAYELENTQRLPLQDFAAISDKFLADARKSPLLTGIQTTFRMNSPQIIIDVDRDKAESIGVRVGEIFTTLQTFIGSLYVNDFDYLDRSYRTYVQADKQFRSNPQDINQLYVRTNAGNMTPISNLVTMTRTTSPPTISHYNLFKSIEINGAPLPGVSSGQAIAEMEAIAKRVLPRGTSYEWTGISLEEIQSGNLAILIFALGLLFVFLVLAAQYESLIDPLVILFAVPLAVLGAISAQMLRGLQNDVFCQIGLVMLIGLASKNSILIVEFANQLHRKGLSYHRAVFEAALTRLRPILMTSLAFVFGILPMAIAEGAGANSRHSLGTTVLGGMILSTILSLYVVPVLYLVFKSIKGIFIKEPPTVLPPDEETVESSELQNTAP